MKTHNQPFVYWDKTYFSVTNLTELKKLQKLGLVIFDRNTEKFRYVNEVKDNTFAWYKGEIYFYKEIYHSGCFMPYVYKRKAELWQIEDIQNPELLPIIFK